MASVNIALVMSVSFGVSLVSLFILARVAPKINLVDTPDHRKNHVGQIPVVGGLAIFLGMISAFSFFPEPGREMSAFVLAAVLIVGIGVLDDLFDVKVRYRLLMQFLASLVLTLGGGMMIQTLGVFGDGASFGLGWFALPFTVFAIMVAINAFNFIDGIDGLSGLLFMITLVAMIALGLGGETGGAFSYAIPMIFIVAIVPYMALNLGLAGKHNRIFLGDAGSMLLGLAVVWLLIRYSQGQSAVFSPTTGTWITAIPLMDMLALVIRRSRNGKAPFNPDRNHLHHLFLDRGISDRRALLIIGLVSLLFAGIGVVSEILKVSQLTMLISFLLIFFVYYHLSSIVEKRYSKAALAD